MQVAVPLPHPKGQRPSDDYKVSFSFDRKHQRYLAYFNSTITTAVHEAAGINVMLTIMDCDSIVR